jgi:hypothetical protein
MPGWLNIEVMKLFRQLLVFMLLAGAIAAGVFLAQKKEIQAETVEAQSQAAIPAEKTAAGAVSKNELTASNNVTPASDPADGTMAQAGQKTESTAN